MTKVIKATNQCLETTKQKMTSEERITELERENYRIRKREFKANLILQSINELFA